MPQATVTEGAAEGLERCRHFLALNFDQPDCLAKPEQWPGLKSFTVIESERTINGKASLEHRFYISSLPADAQCLARAVRSH